MNKEMIANPEPGGEQKVSAFRRHVATANELERKKLKANAGSKKIAKLQGEQDRHDQAAGIIARDLGNTISGTNEGLLINYPDQKGASIHTQASMVDEKTGGSTSSVNVNLAEHPTKPHAIDPKKILNQ